MTEEILQRLFDELTSKPDSGVLPVLEIADTVKKQDDSGITTIDRRQLYRAQTPQCFQARISPCTGRSRTGRQSVSNDR